MATTVVHYKKDKYDVLIDRTTPWGNPFVIGVDGNRSEVITKYMQYLAENPELYERAKVELKDKVLGCWCKPQPCHGDILAALVNEES